MQTVSQWRKHAESLAKEAKRRAMNAYKNVYREAKRRERMSLKHKKGK